MMKPKQSDTARRDGEMVTIADLKPGDRVRSPDASNPRFHLVQTIEPVGAHQFRLIFENGESQVEGKTWRILRQVD